MAWDRIHPRLTTCSAWINHTGELPLIEGTLIRLHVDRLPGGHDPLPLWLWWSATGLSGEDVDVGRQAYLRRFDLEHTFRLMRQTLGWTLPKIRTPEAGDRWTWLVIAAHIQLRLARTLTTDLPPLGKTHRTRPSHPLTGSKNRRAAPHHDVGETVRRPETLKERSGAGG